MTVIGPGALRLRTPNASRWRSRSFGLDLNLGFNAPGLPRATAPGTPIETTVELVYAESLRAAWPGAGARRSGLMGPAERPVMTVDEHPEAGYLIHLWPHGRYLVSLDATFIACAPPSVGWWYWQRLLIGQVLPAAAALRGYEVFHASAVRIGDRALAFAGTPGAGKSSLALRFLQRGATLLAEDVVVVGDAGGRLAVEPGSAMVNVTEHERSRFDEREWTTLGEVVGRSHGKAHVLVPRENRPTPLAVMYVLERDDGALPMFEEISDVGAAEILANSFVSYIYRADRMIRQLELASLLARTVPIFKLRVQPGWTAARLAEAVEAHAEAMG
jgi:hypothetical protein